MDGEINGLKELGTLQSAVKNSQAMCVHLYNSVINDSSKAVSTYTDYSISQGLVLIL